VAHSQAVQKLYHELAQERLRRQASDLEAARRARLGFDAAWMPPRLAAAALGCSIRTLRRWSRAGRGPEPVRRGETLARLFYRSGDVARYAADPAAFEAQKARQRLPGRDRDSGGRP